MSSFNSAFDGTPVTLTLSGHSFSPNTTVSLVQGTISVPATHVFFVNPDTLDGDLRQHHQSRCLWRCGQ